MMPYIKQTQRIRFDDYIDNISVRTESKGDVVYCVTALVHKFVLSLGKPCFNTKSTGKSILQDALDEYKRVVMDKHENKKRRENGAISELDAVQLEDVR